MPHAAHPARRRNHTHLTRAMGLTLTTLRCPDAVPPERRQASGGEFTIGRGPDNDWTLPDPDRHLSKRHCVVAYRSGQWQVSDLSANGTFLNRETAPVGAAPRPLRDGDRLRFGPYEVEVSIVEDAFEGLRPASRPAAPALDPFDDPPTPLWGREPDPLLSPKGSDLLGPSMRLPSDFDPLRPAEDPFSGPTRSDHVPAINEAFRPPPVASGIPDDWDLDAPLTPPPLAPPPPPPAPPRPATAAPSAQLLPDDDDDWLLPAAAPPAPPPAALPPDDPMPSSAPMAPPTPAPALPPVPMAATPLPPPPVPLPAAAPVPASGNALLAAFLRGAGADSMPADPERTLEAAGAALRATVAGIRQALIARASIKGEFRIEQTMVRAQGNNPLKFSADDDDAMAAFLGTGRRHAMPGAQAVTEALRDMRLHELATISAMQAAVRALVAEFDPQGIEKGVEGGFTVLPAQRKARAWDAFEAMHARVSQALSDDFDSVFGKAFARAYEQALRDAHQEDRP